MYDIIIIRNLQMQTKGGVKMELNLTAIRVELARKNWNYKDLAKHSNISYSTLISIMTGARNGSIQTMGKIAKGLDVDVTDILKDTEEIAL
jgi:transcriptional regulator with XRE-family HTH domain